MISLWKNNKIKLEVERELGACMKIIMLNTAGVSGVLLLASYHTRRWDRVTIIISKNSLHPVTFCIFFCYYYAFDSTGKQQWRTQKEEIEKKITACS